MNNRKVIRAFSMVVQVSLSMMVPIFLCGALGYWLNVRFGKLWCFVVLIILGVGAAFRSLFTVTKSFYAGDLKKEEEQKEYMKSLKEYHILHPEEDFSDVMQPKKKRYPDNKGQTRH